jgi:rhodanese-related sulfurtransferase
MHEIAQIPEALPEIEYVGGHLRRAMNIPLKERNPKSASRVNRGTPIVVYCWDYL